jgi:translation elongation factor EF-G
MSARTEGSTSLICDATPANGDTADGHPIDDVRVEFYDGSYHDLHSSEMAFRIAGSMAFREAAMKAGPVLMEQVEKRRVARRS